MKNKLFLVLSGLPAALGVGLWWISGGGFLGLFLRSYAVVFLTICLGVALALGLRRLLWRVGHRLAFSYFLIGVVPIPLVALMALVVAYIGMGLLLGHLYRDAVQTVASELRIAAEAQLRSARGNRSEPRIPVSFTYYHDGQRLGGGDQRAPREWQDWWVKSTAEREVLSPDGTFYVALEDGRPTLMAARTRERFGILALYEGDLERELSERSGIWVELLRADETRRDGVEPFSFTFQERDYSLRRPHLDWENEELREFFHAGEDHPGLLERPSLMWADISRPFLDLGRGDHAADFVYATLIASPRTIGFHLISYSHEIDTFAYVVLITLAFALFNIWVLAAIMALFMILGLSRAVNKMSLATRRVRQGDFSTRIEVFRRDQIGELQGSFNQMTSNLEKLVASAAQKEILEKELEIARQLQHSLLPGELATDETLCFATHFAPSTAIGGDYYDVLPVSDGRVAVVVADVSGHGVAAGLRMAMVKSALQVLMEEESDPRKIFGRLHQLQKSPPSLQSPASRRNRGFVTATLALIDRQSGQVEITNAGHSPTYRWRRGKVEEITLPSPPLGGLDGPFGQKTLRLEAGDALVLLSDGLIEATNSSEEPFGYDGVIQALESFSLEDVPYPDVPYLGGDKGSDRQVAEGLRDHLLKLLDLHTGGTPPDDDRTLVVMIYR